jgi:transcriptional regulator with XRE-family HTH domain
MARTALSLGIRELAVAAKVSPDTVARFERGEPLRERTVDAMQSALELAGVEFIAENGGGPGVRLGPYTVRISRAGAVESSRHFIHKEDAIAAARDWLHTAKKNGEEVYYSHREGLWWAAIDGKPADQTLILGGPIGSAPDDLNLELKIASEEE